MTLSDIQKQPVEEWRQMTAEQLQEYFRSIPPYTSAPNPNPSVWTTLPAIPTVWIDPNIVNNGCGILYNSTTSTFV